MTPDRNQDQPHPSGSAASATAGAFGARPELPGETEHVAVQAFYTPIWLVGVLGLLMYWGGLYLDHNGGGFQPVVPDPGLFVADYDSRRVVSPEEALRRQGSKVFKLYCAACHQESGRGDADKPPLAGSDWVNASGPNRVIRILLNGLHDPITVSGKQFNNQMLPWREVLTNDTDIAAVLTYVRTNKEWGNGASAVTPAQVKKIRADTESRGSDNWTPTELLQIPDKD